jgi:hypothetical protein
MMEERLKKKMEPAEILLAVKISFITKKAIE